MGRSFFVISILFSRFLSATPTLNVENLTELRGARLGVSKFDSVPGLREKLKKVRIAVIDNGFGNLKTLPDFLPPSVFQLVEYDEKFLEKNNLGGAVQALDAAETHGRSMALTAWAATGYDEKTAPQFFLLNGKGFTNLKRAVRWCIENGIHIVLYSQNWEYGGNFDGKGFINAVINQATSAGIHWVNAAGNYRGKVFNDFLRVGQDNWVRFSNKQNHLRLKSRYDQNPVRIILSWSRYTEREGDGTDLDLDLYVQDEFGNEVLKAETEEEKRKLPGRLNQILGKEGLENAGEGNSFIPREIIETKLPRNKEGTFQIKILHKGGKIRPTDQIRVTVLAGREMSEIDGKVVIPLEFMDASKECQTMIPADNPTATTISDLGIFAALGPTMGLIPGQKPDFVLERSDIQFSDGEGEAGTSHAAALGVGVIAMLSAAEMTIRQTDKPTLTRKQVLAMAKGNEFIVAQQTAEKSGIENLGITHVREMQWAVLSGIEQILNTDKKKDFNPIVLAGRVKEGPYVVAIDRSPWDLKKFFTHLPQWQKDEEGELYLTAKAGSKGEPLVYAYARKAGSKGKEAWEEELQTAPQRFVRVVKVRMVSQPEKQGGRTVPVTAPVWRTPDYSALKYFL